MSNPNQARTFVTRLDIKDTGSYNPMFQRSYATSLAGGTIESVVERVGSSNRFSPMLLSGVAGQFLQPAAAPDNPNPIGIPNGWEERRGRFVMEVVHEFPGMGTQVVELVTGFTDYMGFTTSDTVDPNMNFYVNNCVQLKTIPMVQTPGGYQSKLMVADNSHVLADAGFSTIYTAEKQQKMRPEDVYSTMSRLDAVTTPNTTDMRTTLTATAVKSRRSNSLPSAYMASVLENHRVASQLGELGTGELDILMAARGKSAEPSIPRDPFLHAISQFHNQQSTKVFTYRELLMLDPNVDRVKRLGFTPPAEMGKVHRANSGESADWNQQTQETVIATMLSQGVVALMMDLGIGAIGFYATNQTAGGVFHYQPYHIHGFSTMDMSGADFMFRDAFASKLWQDIATVPGGGGQQFMLNVEVVAQAMGDTKITVQFESNQPVTFVVPTYCDSLVVPVLTNQVDKAEKLARDFREIIRVVQEETSGFQNVIQQGGALFSGT